MKKYILFFALFMSPYFASAADKVIPVKVTVQGFEPNSIQVSPNDNVILKVTRTTENTCATEVLVGASKKQTPLPLNQEVTIALGKLKAGEVHFGCAMKMMIGGVIHVK